MVEFTIAEGRQLLSDIVKFVGEFSWLYEFHGTQILGSSVLKDLPTDWHSALTALTTDQLNGLAVCRSQKEFPASLQSFLQQCSRLSIHSLLPDAANQCQHESLLQWDGTGVSPKKRHEVVRLAGLVADVCQRSSTHTVLDIGAGLGYVDSLLHHELGLRVLGAECEAARVVQSRARHVKLCGRECPDLQFVQWRLREDRQTVHRAGAVIEQLLRHAADDTVSSGCGCQKLQVTSRTARVIENKMTAVTTTAESDLECDVTSESGGEEHDAHSEMDDDAAKNVEDGDVSSFCPEVSGDTMNVDKVDEAVTLLGLHACADLSPLMIRIFMCCSKISSLILLSCCYHKMKTLDSEPPGNDDQDDELFQHVNVEENEAEQTRMSETSEGYESDVSDESASPHRTNERRQKYNPNKDKNKYSNQTNTPPMSSFKRHFEFVTFYKNFPLSRSLSLLMSLSGFNLSVYGLRLACQEPGVRWAHMNEADHEQHQNALLFRAVLDDVCATSGVELKKKKRRCSKKEQFSSFETYLSSLTDSYEVTFKNVHQEKVCHLSSINKREMSHSAEDSPACSSHNQRGTSKIAQSGLSQSSGSALGKDEKDRLKCTRDSSVFGSSLESNFEEDPAPASTILTLDRLMPALRACHEKHKHLGPLLEAVTALQLAMQGVLESLVLLDRVLYTLESQFCSSVQLVKVFDASLSPRCVAMVLYK